MKRNPWLLLISAALAACFALRAPAQATPPAYEGAGGIRVGFAYSNADPDEETKRIGGFSVYGIYGVLPHFSLEADVHLLQFFTPEDFAESSYLVGGRVYYRKQRYEPYLKFLGGVVRTTTQANGVSVAGAPDAYGAFAGGGGLDIHVPHKFVIRAVDYEVQVLPGFSPHDLTPSILSFGVAYRIR